MIEHTHSATVGDKGRFTIPEDVRENLGIQPGDVVIIELTDRGTAEIIPAALIPRDQVWFSHREMRARMSEARGDVEAGRVSEVRTPAALRAHLKRLKGESQSD